MEGEVMEECSNATFKVEINPDLPPIFCTISGKMRKSFVRIQVGDKVKLELSPYDLTKGRITFRYPTPGIPTTPVGKNPKPGKKKK